MTKKEKALIITLGIGTTVATGVSIYLCIKMNRTLNNLNIASNNIKKLTHVEIEKNIMDQAAKDAVTNEVKDIAKDAARNVENETIRIIEKVVNHKANSLYGTMKDSVKKEIETQVKRVVNIRELAEEAKNEAKNEIADRISKSLDDTLDDYNKQLDNVNKIYQSIADSMSGKAPKNNDVSTKSINLNL